MSNLHCMAVDDEPLALDIVEEFCRRIPDLDLVARAGSAVEAAAILEHVPVDWVCLDINMPHGSGGELARRTERMPRVIFTTAYPDYAVTGFELDAVDYLLKPFSFERFERSVDRARARRGLQERSGEAAQSAPECLFVRVDYATVRIDRSEILYVEGLKDYVRIVTPARSYVTKLSLKKVERALHGDAFLRVHKSYLVNLARVEAVETGFVRIGGQRIPVGTSSRKPLIDYLRSNRV